MTKHQLCLHSVFAGATTGTFSYSHLCLPLLKLEFLPLSTVKTQEAEFLHYDDVAFATKARVWLPATLSS